MPNTTRQGRLLVLDDEPEVCFTLCAIADSAGFESRSCTHASTFLETVEDWAPTHLVIDLHMPDIDGVETLKALAEIGCGAAVIVTSGLGSRVLEAAGRAAEENGLRVLGILAKPFTPNHLRTLLLSDGGDDNRQPSRTPPRGASVTEDDLDLALYHGQIQPFFQPKIYCGSSSVAGFECLSRWRHPELGILMPDVFIPLAERRGRMIVLSQKIIEQSLRWFKQIDVDSDIKLAINLSPSVLEDENFPRWLIQCCSEFEIDPQQIILEITESSSMDNPVAMLEFLTQFRIKGFNLSIDDFGVGFSSLIQLARLPFSEMKIDKMFVVTAPRSEESQKIVTAIVGLASALGLTVTAEGVEDGWTLNFLRDIGCTTAQGFFIARPMPGDEAIVWLNRYRGK